MSTEERKTKDANNERKRLQRARDRKNKLVAFKAERLTQAEKTQFDSLHTKIQNARPIENKTD